MSHDAVLNSKANEKSNPEIIYQCYQPINVTELREYMLFCISRDLQASRQCVDEERNENIDASSPDYDPSSPITNGKIEETTDNNTSKFANSIDAKIIKLKATVFAAEKLNPKLGTGKVQNLSSRLTRYMQELEESFARLLRKYNGDVLLIDTIHESGNLLRADRITTSEYRLYMQVDTNTRGH